MAAEGIVQSFLMTPHPHHIPGYDGHCPQYKFRAGNTFGRTTMQLFRDPNVTSSGNLVLMPLHAHAQAQSDEAAERSHQRAQLVKTRTQSYGDQKYVETMIPGYKGFVPKAQKYFGKRFAEDCFNAITDFENDQRLNNQKRQTLRDIEASQSGKKVEGLKLPVIHTSRTLPLKPVSRRAAVFVSRSAPGYPVSVYRLDNSDPDKSFISGYAGFVPRSRGLLGHGFPIITHAALGEFTDEQRAFRARQREPATLRREPAPAASGAEAPPGGVGVLYPKCSGIVPHYTGHVPGQKFRHGHTFGRHTVDAKRTKAEAAAAY